MDDSLGAIMAIPDAVEGVAYLYSLICLLLNAYTSAIPNALVKVACWIMVIIFVWEVVKIVISLFSDDEFGVMDWVSVITIGIALICAICVFIFKSQIYKTFEMTQAITTFEWFSMCLVLFYAISQFTNLIPDIISSFIDDD